MSWGHVFFLWFNYYMQDMLFRLNGCSEAPGISFIPLCEDPTCVWQFLLRLIPRALGTYSFQIEWNDITSK